MPNEGSLAPLDVVIAGVPKCGTSSLFHALSAHPDIQGSEPEETYYFTDGVTRPELTGLNFHAQGWEGLERFYPADRAGRRRLEGSAINLFQDTALTQFAALTPQPLIVVTLRCPAEQIRSAFYFHRSFGRIDPDLDFPTYAAALQDGNTALLTSAVPYEDVRAVLAPSMTWNRYAQWLDRWHESFPAERIVVATLREIAREPVSVLQSICAKLGIDQTFYEGYIAPQVNPTSAGQVRSPGLLSRVVRRVLPAGPLREFAGQWNQRRRMGALLGPPSADDEKVLNELGAFFAPFNDDLARRYGVDTSSWRPHDAAMT